MRSNPLFAFARPVVPTLLVLAALPAAAAWEPTAAGAQTKVQVDYVTRIVHPDPEVPPTNMWRQHSATGAGHATVPSASAAAAPGHNSVSNDVSVDVLERLYGETPVDIGNALPSGHAESRWWDTWTVTGGSGAGTLQVTLHYSEGWRGDSILSYLLTQETAAGSRELIGFESGAIVSPELQGFSVHEIEIPFEYGQAFQLVSATSAVIGTSGTFGSRTYAELGVDFYRVELPAGAMLSVASGDPSVYHVVTTPVPEPATWALLLLGFGGLVLRRVDSHTGGDSV